MTREFLKNLGLEDAVIGRILDENMDEIGKEKSKTNTAQKELSSVQEKLKTAIGELETMQKANGNAAAVQKQLEDLQAKYDADIAERDAKLAERDYADAINQAISSKGLKFSSKSAQRSFVASLKEKKLELKDGELTGLDDFIKAQKEEDPDAFAPDKPVPHFVGPTGVGGAPAEPVPANIAQAKAMGAAKAAAQKSSIDALKNYM